MPASSISTYFSSLFVLDIIVIFFLGLDEGTVIFVGNVKVKAFLVLFIVLKVRKTHFKLILLNSEQEMKTFGSEGGVCP